MRSCQSPLRRCLQLLLPYASRAHANLIPVANPSSRRKMRRLRIASGLPIPQSNAPPHKRHLRPAPLRWLGPCTSSSFFGSRHTRFSSFHIPEHFQGFYLLGASKSWFSFVSCPMWCVLPCLSQHVRLDIRPAGFGLIPTAAQTAKDRCRELRRGIALRSCSRQVGTATPARPGNP